MDEQITENIFYQRGYAKGYADAENNLIKLQNEAYDKGYQEGANQKDNKPCVCGFWGEKDSREESKCEYIIIDWSRPHGHERVPTKEKIILTKDEAYDLNKMLTLNGENKRYIKL